MEKIPTAEKYLLGTSTDNDISKGLIKPTSCTRIMIEFAKLHVEAALKEASEKALVYADEGGYSEFVDEQSILNSYSLDNIK